MKHKQVFSMNLTGPIDYGFRNNYMFRTALQLSQKALTGLISSLLHLPPSAIKSVTITNPIALGATIEDKDFILDTNVLLNNNALINLEMQVNNLYNWPERSLSYLCRNFDQLNKGQNYYSSFLAVIRISSHEIDRNKAAHLSIPYALSASVANSICLSLPQIV